YELYDLTGDPGEAFNLLEAQAPKGAVGTIAEDLRTDLVGWLDRQQPAFPTDTATGKRVVSPVPFDRARFDVGRFEGKPKGGEDEGETDSPKRQNRRNQPKKDNNPGSG
ncbi:MAG: hypothetical protein V4671_31795, partial [Armatimonadota bacterium]